MYLRTTKRRILLAQGRPKKTGPVFERALLLASRPADATRVYSTRIARAVMPHHRAAPIALLIALASATCASPSSGPPATPTITLPSPSPSRHEAAVVAPSSGDRCARIRKRIRRTLADAPQIEDRGGGGFVPEHKADLCWATARDAWGVVFEDFQPYGVPGERSMRMRWRLLYDDGEIVTGPANDVEVGPFDGAISFAALLFDYDGDGRSEVALLVQRYYHMFDEQEGSLLTLRDGHIMPYGTLAFVGIADEDEDGRPDLLTDVPFRENSGCRGGLLSTLMGPYFLAHSLADGRFSMNDDEAQRYAREGWRPYVRTDGVGQRYASEGCPSAPDLASIGAAVTLKDVRCARIWSTPTASIMAVLAPPCGPMGMTYCSCVGYDTFADFAQATPPVQLQSP